MLDNSLNETRTVRSSNTKPRSSEFEHKLYIFASFNSACVHVDDDLPYVSPPPDWEIEIVHCTDSSSAKDSVTDPLRSNPVFWGTSICMVPEVSVAWVSAASSPTICAERNSPAIAAICGVPFVVYASSSICAVESSEWLVTANPSPVAVFPSTVRKYSSGTSGSSSATPPRGYLLDDFRDHNGRIRRRVRQPDTERIKGSFSIRIVVFGGVNIISCNHK